MTTVTKKNTQWDFTKLLPQTDEAYIKQKQKKIETKSYEFINKWKDRDDYLTSPKSLKEALDEYEIWGRYYAGAGAIGYYYDLSLSLDENNSELKAKHNKIDEFSKKIANDIRFFTHRISLITQSSQKIFLENKDLKPYKHFLEKLFSEAKYLLSEPEEKILMLKSGPAASNWARMTSSFLSKEERDILDEDGTKKKKNFSEIIGLIDSTNKKVRDSAAKAFNDINAKYVEVAENEINSILQNKKIDDDLRKMERPDLGRHLADDVDSEVIDTLLATVSSRYDISQRYYKLKAKLLGVKQLKYHERNVPYGSLDKNYDFAESVALVDKVFSQLDPQFSSIFKNFLESGSIDVYPKKGKRSGAFCAYYLPSLPTYILLNHTNKLRDVLTLAHELGHGINNELMKLKQNSINFGTPTSTAEVASTFMEDFVLQEILKEANEELRLSLLMAKLNDEISTIFRQVACYKFEQQLHAQFRAKGYLSQQDIGAIFQTEMAAYMGDAVEQSPGSENWWVYWSHIRYFFYVYSYAGGLLISKSLQNSVKRDHAFIHKVKDFLSAGSSDSPKNIFMKMNVDIADQKFWEKGLHEIDELLDNTTTLAKRVTG